MNWLFPNIPVAIRGGGDLGSGVAYRLHQAGFPMLITELAQPLLVRRAVAFGSAVIEGQITIDGVTARLAHTPDDLATIHAAGEIAAAVDPDGKLLTEYDPVVIVDARMRKIDPGPQPGRPRLVIGLGPGFSAPQNCDAVIETNRGHYLGKVIWEGQAQADTGVPGRVLSRTSDRVLRAPVDGVVSSSAAIGQQLNPGERIALVGATEVSAPFAGVLRGLVHDGLQVRAGAKIGDLDPRADPAYCFTISEKSLAIGGGVLEAILASPSIREIIRQGV